jgi:hypothetical protein
VQIVGDHGDKYSLSGAAVVFVKCGRPERRICELHCKLRHVVIEPVSARSLPKTGIFAVVAGDFRRVGPARS